jgi:rhodanese-related sulfurtransferase
MGSLQALEAIKVLARAPLTAMLSGRLLVVDAEDMRMRTVRIRGRRADCPACAGEDSWTLTQTKAFLEEHQVSVSEGAADSKPACAACDEAAATTAEPAADASEPSTNEVPVSILGPMATGAAGAVGTASYMPLGGRAASDSELQLLEIGSPSRAEAGTPDAEPTKCLVLDVRSVVQRGMCRLPKTLHVPLANLQAAESDGRGSTAAINPLTALRSYMDEAGASGIITLCRRGIDSLTAAELLSRIGIPSWSAKGGLVAFASECDSSFPSY